MGARVSDPTLWYSWAIPDVGGDIGTWDTILNKVYGEDNADADNDPYPGIDEVLFLLETDLDTLKTDIDGVLSRITTLEANAITSMGGRVEMSGGQAITPDVSTQLTFGSVQFDEGATTTDTKAITVPTSGAGAWQIRASVTAERHADADDGRFWELLVKKNGVEIARKRERWINDGQVSGSSTVTVGLTVLDPSAVETDVYTAWVEQGDADSSGDNSTVAVGEGTFLQGARIFHENAQSFVRSMVLSVDNTASTQHTYSMPSLERVAGDIVVLVFCHRNTGAITLPSGYTALTNNDDGTMSGTAYFRRVTVGEPGGDDIIITKTGTDSSSVFIAVLRGMDQTNDPEDAANDGDGDPPSLTPSWGATKTVFLAISAPGEEESVSDAPTNYDSTNPAGAAGSGSECGIDGAFRLGKIATENPGAFTYASAVDGICWTIGIEVA